jgi:hypothetical protein
MPHVLALTGIQRRTRREHVTERGMRTQPWWPAPGRLAIGRPCDHAEAAGGSGYEARAAISEKQQSRLAQGSDRAIQVAGVPQGVPA